MLPAPSPPDFDRVAGFYDALAQLVFGRRLRRAQEQALAYLPPGACQVLFVGGGTGQVLPALWQHRPQARVLFLEASAQMVRRAQARVARQCPQFAPQIEFRVGTEARLRPTEQFDAVLTFFLLDLFAPAPLAALVARLRLACRPGATWLVVDFAPPRQAWQRGLHGLMYAFFQLTTGISARRLPEVRAALAAVGLRPQWARTAGRGLLETILFCAEKRP